MSERRGYGVLVFFAAFCCLLFELVISRLADFHLDSRNSFLAIPIAFLGLALGSLHVHFRPRIAENFSIRRNVVFLSCVSLLTLAVVFVLFGQYLKVTGAYSVLGTLRHSIVKSVVFVVIFILPFYWFGRVLTACYHINRDRIGVIYSADFFGASLGCFLTPILFRYLNLPGVLGLFVVGLSLLAVRFSGLSRKGMALLALPVLVADAFLVFLMVYADNHVRFDDFFAAEKTGTAREIAHGWNEFSRVSVIEITNPGGGKYFKIIHDNAQSNVEVAPYSPGKTRNARLPQSTEVLFLTGRPVQDVLVMFAGCGAQMIPFYEFSGGKTHITGVELNPLVKELAVKTPELASFRLGEFYQLPDVDLRVAEGRAFLVNEPKKYDVIFVASKAPMNLQLTGHSRKYLDTVEAYGLYLDHLKPGGVLCFNHQPLGDVVTTLKRIFKARGLPAFEKCAVVVKAGRSFDLIVAPDGFSGKEVTRLLDADNAGKPNVVYAPLFKDKSGRFADMIRREGDPLELPITDDRPFIWNLDFAGYRLLPDIGNLKNDLYYFNWTRITMLLVLCGLALFFIALVLVPRGTRPPAAAFAYLLATGFCYLLVEVTFMAKFELFLQDLFISMATTLTVFLLSSGLGSRLSRRFKPEAGLVGLPFITGVVVFVSIVILDYITRNLLGLPLAARIGLVVLLTMPVGVCLGMFYPLFISALLRHGRDNVVPITYGLSTLSSVIGATYAMTMMMEFGFNNLLKQASTVYIIVGGFIVLNRLISKRSLFRFPN